MTGSESGPPPDHSAPESPVYLVVGRIGRPHGVRGEVQFRVLTGFPERLVPEKRIYLGEDKTPVTISSLRGSGSRQILHIDGVTDRDAAALLRNQDVFVPVGEIPTLPEGEYYHHELIGLRVTTDEGEVLGRLVEVLETGANDVFVVKNEAGEERLLPATDEVVLEIDLHAGQILVHLIAGL